MTRLRWWGGQSEVPPPGTGSFGVTIYEDSAGSPGAAVRVFVLGDQVWGGQTGRSIDSAIGSLPECAHSAELAGGVPLNAQTGYWVEIANDTT